MDLSLDITFTNITVVVVWGGLMIGGPTRRVDAVRLSNSRPRETLALLSVNTDTPAMEASTSR
jgi:hypothetical protein